MDGVQGGNAQQFQSVQTQTDSASEVGKSHTHESVRKAEVQSTPGLTEPGTVKHISLKTRIANALNNNWAPIGDGAKAGVLNNISNADTKAKVSKAIDAHDNGVKKLTNLKGEKQGLESKVKELEKDKNFMKMVEIVTNGKCSEKDVKKGKSVLMQGNDGQLKAMEFKHNNKTVNLGSMKVAVDSFKSSPQFSEYTENLTRIKDITQERAEIKESLRDSGKQTAADLKTDARQQHKDIRDGLKAVKNSELKDAGSESEKIKSGYGDLKYGIKKQKHEVEKALQELRSDRSKARSKVRGGLAAKLGNWNKKNIGALASRLTPKGVTVDSSSIETERASIDDDLQNNRNSVSNLGEKIKIKKKTKDALDNAMNDFRKGRDDAFKEGKEEKQLLKDSARVDHEWNKLEEEGRYDMAKDDNKDVAKALKGKKTKSDKK
ncbi:hypothetical protein [Endozoicomonas sp.]|uniref:hypothetical protein n=1 Tax=Endozoicomonas sp. TaxID=1892382 RepID=UPI0028850138|nr:hypothetical protein [Endozoicomonas sp.]